MKVLRESYTDEEVAERVIDVRDSINDLRESLYVLLTALEDRKNYKSNYVQNFVDAIEDWRSEFVTEFEDIFNSQIDD